MAMFLPTISPIIPMDNWPAIQPMNTVDVAAPDTHEACSFSLHSSSLLVQTEADITIKATAIAWKLYCTLKLLRAVIINDS